MVNVNCLARLRLGLENAILQACYDSLSRTREFTLVTYHYDVVIAQSAPNGIKNNIANSFINTMLLCF